MVPAFFRRILLPLILLTGFVCSGSAGIVFQDGFETGNLGPAWSVAVTNQGRVQVSKDNVPAAGLYHLVFDDTTNDAIYSTAQATLSLDLANKKNVVLTFQAKSLGNESNVPPAGNFTGTAAFDGVSVSVDGGNTWRAAVSLAAVPTAWQTYNVTLDATVAALGGSFNANTLIRFSEYDNSPAPIDGIAIDQVSVTADDNFVVVLDMPSVVYEGGGTYTGYVLLNVAPTQPLTVSLGASPTGQLNLPATVIVPAGQAAAAFDFSVVDDSVVNFTRSVTVTPAATGYTAGAATLMVYDNETVNLTLSLPPTLAEGVYPASNATLSIDQPGTSALTVLLSANPASEVSLPSSITIPAGSTKVTFTIQAVDDARLDGNLLVTVTATAANLPSATAQTTTIDNELRTLTVVFGANPVAEGGSTTGTVTIGGTLTTALTVALSSSNTAAATVPASVTIPAGSRTATFTVSAPDNVVLDGSRIVTITATASTFPTLASMLTIRDNDAAGYRITGLTDIVNVSGTTAITVAAADIEGNVISGYAGTVSLSLVLPDGTTRTLTPATATLSGAGGWTGSVTIPVVASSPLRLRAMGPGGLTGDSAAFDPMRVINLTTGDLLWDAARSRLCASVSSTDTNGYANQVVTIDPAAGQITGGVALANNPGQLALTSGGEQLYVVLTGNGNIARITPGTLVVNQTFALGTDPNNGTYYARDFCTVAGQPNLLVVARSFANTISTGGVAAYDNGVMRAKVTTVFDEADYIEPSADPALFFGYNTGSTEFGFRQLKLDSTGITVTAVNTSLIGGFSTDIRSAGSAVFSTSGVKVDGAQMRRLGVFSLAGSGPVCPDLAANRVYFVEPTDTYSGYFNQVSAYDPNAFTLIRKLSLPSSLTLPTSYGNGTSFVRCGTNGLALRTKSAVVLINSTRLVPTDAPANLNVQVQATPNPASATAPLYYTVTVTNNGPNPARNTQVAAVLSDSQTISSLSATTGAPALSGLTVLWSAGDLASGASSVLTMAAMPQSAGSLTCTASATSNAVDPDTSDNLAFKLVSVGFVGGPDTVNKLRLAANNLVYDAARGILWASVPATVNAPLGRSVVAIDPQTGLVSDPIALNANPTASCMALSGNGRYLYVGLADSPEIARLDLSVSPPSITRLPLGINQWGDAAYALDVEPLDGDGTSFLLTTQGDYGASVYDGAIRRTTRSGIYTATRVERTGTPGTFVSYNGYDTGFELSKMVVTPSGVTASQTNGNVISGFYADISGAGTLALSSTGLLVNSNTLTLRTNLGVTGRPCLDLVNGRAYLVNGASVYGFDSSTGLSIGNLALPVTQSGDWALNCVRWGLDGFAILGSDGKVYVARWSSTIPATMDTNGNGVSDAWEAAWFNSLSVNMFADNDGDGIANALEYLFNTSPTQAAGSPMQLAGVTANSAGQAVMRLVFPRRAVLAAGSYGYESSDDLVAWTANQNVLETVLSSQTVSGVKVDTVQADVTLPTTAHGFVRLRWLPGAGGTSGLTNFSTVGAPVSAAPKARR